MEQDITSTREDSCVKTNEPVAAKLWTIEYTCHTYRGVAVVKAYTVEEAQTLFLNGTNFNGEKHSVLISRITQINPETPRGIVFEYYIDLISIHRN